MAPLRPSPCAAVAAEMAAGARELLGALSADQAAAARWAMDDVERRTWFYTPTDHGGLSLAEMTGAQHRLVWRLIASGLSTPGFNTAALIVGQENLLDALDGFTAGFGRERGRDPLLYWIAIFGEPSDQGAWAWRFAGHHLSLHFTIVDGEPVSATPCFMGADPASAPLLGPHLHRPLAAAEDLGRELVRSLREPQVSAAVVSSAPPPDLIGVNRTSISEGDRSLPLPLLWRGRFEAEIDAQLGAMQSELESSLGGSPDELAGLAFSRRPKGIAATELDDAQGEILGELLLAYLGRIDDELADVQLARVAESREALHFLWAGSTEPGQPHYYRIQGGDLLIEYDSAQRGGNHVHTVWRDLRFDFGGDPLAEHRVAD